MEEYYDIQEELEDRYGDLPKSVQNLLELVLLKAEAHALGICAIQQKGTNIVVEFRSDAPLDPQKLTQCITQNKGRYLFTAGVSPYVTVKMKKDEMQKGVSYIKNLLQELKA